MGWDGVGTHIGRRTESAETHWATLDGHPVLAVLGARDVGGGVEFAQVECRFGDRDSR